MFSENNLLLLTDSYKASHYVQYPPNTTKVYSYLESRGGKFKHTVFFGLQYLLKKYLSGRVVDEDKIDQAHSLYKEHFGQELFNVEGWHYIVKKHAGYLPVLIRAVPEGTVVPTSNVLITIENTDPKCYWLTNYLETLLVQVWYPITVATQSWYMKQCLLDYLEKTGDPGLIDFKMHDFGFRGVSSVETAGIGGMAHLVNFKGTDTVEGIVYANNYYTAGVSGYSIPASEHSTITSWGKERERCAFENMLDKYPTGLVACVSDSYNIFEACEKLWGEDLRMKVLTRDGTLVIRPDSGDPLKVLPKILIILGEKFGYTVNSKGFKVLNPKVRLIQGDGIDYESMNDILREITYHGWSADNIAFGSGGGLLQKLDRDTCKFAFKCSYAEIDNKSIDVYKSPVTDSGKNSKRGRLALSKVSCSNGYSFRTIDDNKIGGGNQLRNVFVNGTLLEQDNFETIRIRATETGKAVKGFDGI